MTGNEYQKMASRTINTEFGAEGVEQHALHGLAGEVGEIHSIYQKSFQGHKIIDTQIKFEIGDLLWFIAELCTCYGWDLEDVMEMNIRKLKKRYPNGFESERSINREE